MSLNEKKKKMKVAFIRLFESYPPHRSLIADYYRVKLIDFMNNHWDMVTM